MKVKAEYIADSGRRRFLIAEISDPVLCSRSLALAAYDFQLSGLI